ncbi:DUF771 domain-containing protein [Alkalihalobacillus sp. NPDC078783]
MIEFTIKAKEEEFRELVRKEIDLYVGERANQLAINKVWWSMSDLKTITGKGEDWLKENFLLRPEIKKKIDVNNGGFVHYPNSKGDKWCFLARKTQVYIEENFSSIYT